MTDWIDKDDPRLMEAYRSAMEAFLTAPVSMRLLERQRRIREVLAKPVGQRY